MLFAQTDIQTRVPLVKRRFQLASLVATALLLLAPGFSQAAVVDELFADGNRLFRDDLYFAALLRYRQAQDAGLDTPQLHYNMGVAHYKAKQYVRARESFEKAAIASRLAPHSHYNLGLNAWADGDDAEALRWFRRARDQQQNENISILARHAIVRLGAESRSEDTVVVRARAKETERDISDFTYRVTIGGGMDDNVFRSPAEPYVDQSDPTLPQVTPVVQEGFFIPVGLKAKYSVNSFEHESFFGAYRFGGRFYQDKALENANEYLHEISFGTEYERQKETRKRQLYSAFTIAQHDEIYYDRDSGGSQTVNDVDLDDRMDYMRYGPEVWFRQSYERLSLGARLKGQLWNYKDTVEVPEYDHEYILFGINGQYQFTRTSLLRLTAEMYKRHFTERPSFDLDGTQSILNPPIRYDYLELGVSARQRITRSMWFGINYLRTDRTDRHVGYNNYVKNGYGADFHWGIGSRFDFEATGLFEVYDYENAFAFQNPDAGRKTLERITASAIATIRMTRHLFAIAEYRYDDADSNDARIAYNRSRIFLSIRWEH